MGLEGALEAERGKCFSCGYVGKRLLAHPNVLLEALSENRAEGKLWWGNSQSAMPWCLKERQEFHQEVQALRAATEHSDQDAPRYRGTLGILLKERACPEWFGYRPQEDPAAHRRAEDAIRLEEVRQANALKVAELEQRSNEATLAMLSELKSIAAEHSKTAASQAELADQMVKLQAESGRIETESGASQRRYNLAFIVLAVLAFAGALLSIPWVNDHLLPQGDPQRVVIVVTPIPAPTPTPEPTSQPTPDAGGSPSD